MRERHYHKGGLALAIKHFQSSARRYISRQRHGRSMIPFRSTAVRTLCAERCHASIIGKHWIAPFLGTFVYRDKGKGGTQNRYTPRKIISRIALAHIRNIVISGFCSRICSQSTCAAQSGNNWKIQKEQSRCSQTFRRASFLFLFFLSRRYLDYQESLGKYTSCELSVSQNIG